MLRQMSIKDRSDFCSRLQYVMDTYCTVTYSSSSSCSTHYACTCMWINLNYGVLSTPDQPRREVKNGEHGAWCFKCDTQYFDPKQIRNMFNFIHVIELCIFRALNVVFSIVEMMNHVCVNINFKYYLHLHANVSLTLALTLT